MIAQDRLLAKPVQVINVDLPDRSSSFAYDDLDATIAKEAKTAADLIRGSLDSAKRSMFDIGTALLTIKDKLSHGQFGDWIRAEFEMTGRTAQNYMSVVKAFGAKCETISVLQPTSIYLLASKSTPSAVRENVIAEIEKGNVPTGKEIAARVAAKREATRQAVGKKDQPSVAEDVPVGQEASGGVKGLSPKQAADEAMKLVKRSLGEDLPRFLVLVKQAGGLFGDRLEKHVGA